MKQSKISVIICAGGRGERAGFLQNKLLSPLYGEPALYRTLTKFAFADELVIAASEDSYAEICALSLPFGGIVVPGGENRTQSVKRALERVTGDIVLIHDGARPFVTKEAIERCIESVEKYGSGVCAVKVSDTTVVGENGKISGRLDRDCLYAVQTPQGFLTEEIKRAYSLVGDGSFTDDSDVYGRYIRPAHLVEGDVTNRKLTYKSDFDMLVPPVELGERVGFGVDVHAFGEGNEVTLGGVKIPCSHSLIAHSDGDVIAHAVMDALLSAAGLKDIGRYFPDSDVKYKNADSMCLLDRTVEIIKERGLSPYSLSISVQAEEPRLAPYTDRMIDNLHRHTGIGKDRIGLAAGTAEGLGFVGSHGGITVYCIAAVEEI